VDRLDAKLARGVGALHLLGGDRAAVVAEAHHLRGEVRGEGRRER